ncbi:MAG: NAD(P)-binding protein, partial [Hyphomicrobiales bacterium]
MGANIGRRAFLAGAASAGAVAMPFVARASAPSDTDIVIIGAGASGLAAARTFQARNIAFKLIEIRDRIGGRGYTNTDYFGVPVDFGCSELHHARANPWVAYARQNGFAVGPLPGDDADRI